MLAVRRDPRSMGLASYRHVLCASWQAFKSLASQSANGQSAGACLASCSQTAPRTAPRTGSSLPAAVERFLAQKLLQQKLLQREIWPPPGVKEACKSSVQPLSLRIPYLWRDGGLEQANVCARMRGLRYGSGTPRPGGAISVRLASSAVDRESPTAELEGQVEGEIEAREAARRARGVPAGRMRAVGDGPMGGDAAGPSDCEEGAAGAGGPPLGPPPRSLEQRVTLLERQIRPIGALKGDAFETKARLGGCAWLLDDLGLWASRTLAGNELLGSVRALYEVGALTADVRRVLQRIDLVVEGEHQQTGDKVAVVVETSWQAVRNDVERVRLFADVWRGVCGHMALPLVVCHEARGNVVTEARDAGVLVYKLGEFSANKGEWLVGPEW